MKTIPAKFSIGETVWLMCKNKAVQGNICAIQYMIMEFRTSISYQVASGRTIANMAIDSTSQSLVIREDGRSLFGEDELYESKEQLLKSL